MMMVSAPVLALPDFSKKTDHASLCYLCEQHIPTTEQEKWLIKLMAFDFVIEYYKKGQEN